MENRAESPRNSKSKWPVDGRIGRSTKKSYAWPSVSTVLNEAKVNKIQPVSTTSSNPNLATRYTVGPSIQRQRSTLMTGNDSSMSIQSLSESVFEDRAESVMKMENENEQPKSFQQSNQVKPQATNESTALKAAKPNPLTKKVVNIPVWVLVLVGVSFLLLLIAVALTVGLVLGLRKSQPTVIDVVTTGQPTQSPAQTGSANPSTSITTRQAGTCAYAGLFDSATNKCNCPSNFQGDFCEILPDCQTLPADPIECAQLLSFVELSTLKDEKLIGYCPKSTICAIQTAKTTTTTSTILPTTTTSATTTTTITTVTPKDCLNGGIFDSSVNKCNCLPYWSGSKCEIKPDCSTIPNDPEECAQFIADLNGQPADDSIKAFCPKYFLCP